MKKLKSFLRRRRGDALKIVTLSLTLEDLNENHSQELMIACQVALVLSIVWLIFSYSQDN